MPRFAFSNGLLAQTMVDHYWHGIPMRKLARRMKVRKSALVQASHRLAEKPDDGDRAAFIPRLLELFRDAMTLRNRKRGSKAEYDAESRRIRDEMPAIAATPVKDKRLAEYFGLISKRRDRFFQWVCHPEIPAENNLAERRLRPLVTARKVSFGSLSERGIATRETLMAIVDTLSLRYDDPVARLAETLDVIPENPKADVAKALWR